MDSRQYKRNSRVNLGFTGRTFLVTGAGAGVGRAVARQLANAGAHLVLVDANRAALTACVADCGEAVMSDICVDVQDPSLEPKLPESLDGVFTFAGVMHSGHVADSISADLARVVGVNLIGTMNTVAAALPRLSSDAVIVTASSASTAFAWPGLAPYLASKAGVEAFSRTLAQELQPRGMSVCLCVIGGVKTDIVRHGTFGQSTSREATISTFTNKVARLFPDEAATLILRGVQSRRPVIRIGNDARLGPYVGLLPHRVRAAILKGVH